MARVLVVGAGLNGLATAIHSHISGNQVVILEAKERIGGRGTSQSIEEFQLEHGPHLLEKNGKLHKLLKKVGGLSLSLRPLRPHKVKIIGTGMLYPSGDVKAIMKLKRGEDEEREKALNLLSSWGLNIPQRRESLLKGRLMVPQGGWAGLIGRLAAAADEAGIPIQTKAKFSQRIPGGVLLKDGTKVETDEVVMCVGPKGDGTKVATYDVVLSSKPLLGLHGIVKGDVAILDLASIHPHRSPGHSHLSCIALNGGLSAIESLLDERASGWREEIVVQRRNDSIIISDDGFLSDARV